jgi:iron complex transport system ATP-binding protein
MDLATAPPTRSVGWRAEGVSYRYRGAGENAVEDLTTVIRPGICTAILGPNGSGKSTLLKILLGVLTPTRGTISLANRPLDGWSRLDLARTIGVVPQDEDISFPISVRDLVAMGRYPHLGPFRGERQIDRAAIEAAMARCDMFGLRDRSITALSGGERQRARLARALAQEPTVLVLDEPTRALDVRHEMEILELLRSLTSEGVTVLLVTHNLNLASRYADDLLLMDRGRIVASGSPAEVLRQEHLEQVYRWPLALTAHPGPGRDVGAIQVTPLAPSSDSPSVSTNPESTL